MLSIFPKFLNDAPFALNKTGKFEWDLRVNINKKQIFFIKLDTHYYQLDKCKLITFVYKQTASIPLRP